MHVRVGSFHGPGTGKSLQHSRRTTRVQLYCGNHEHKRHRKSRTKESTNSARCGTDYECHLRITPKYVAARKPSKKSTYQITVKRTKDSADYCTPDDDKNCDTLRNSDYTSAHPTAWSNNFKSGDVGSSRPNNPFEKSNNQPGSYNYQHEREKKCERLHHFPPKYLRAISPFSLHPDAVSYNAIQMQLLVSRGICLCTAHFAP
jgi:hypothetical protein